MKVYKDLPNGCYSGVHVINKTDVDPLFNITRGVLSVWEKGEHITKTVTNIYVNNICCEEEFKLYIEDCSNISCDKEVWTLLNSLDMIMPAVNAIVKDAYARGKAYGKAEQKQGIRELLSLD